MYPARQQENDERRLGDLEAENEKLKAELDELKDKHAEKNQMFAELNEINIRLEEKLEGNGKITGLLFFLFWCIRSPAPFTFSDSRRDSFPVFRNNW